ncbi:MAG: M16 family metallopeptidase, partial [Actinomycetota bacterium]
LGMDTGPRVGPGRAPAVRAPGTVPAPSGATLVHPRKTEQAHICLGTNAYSRQDPERFAFGVVNSALGGGMSSRLFQEVREKRGLAYSVYSYHSMFTETGQFVAYAGTTPAKAREVLDIIRDQIHDVAGGGLAEAELERAKGHMKGALVLSLEDTSGRMSRIGKSEISHGEILSVDDVLGRIDAVTLDDATEVARRVFERPMALAVIGPFAEDAFETGGGEGTAEMGVAAHAPASGAEAAVR